MESRERLVLPVALAVTVMWIAAGFVALFTGNPQVFVIATGPFGIMSGYVFGIKIMRRNGNGT